jgi:phage replication-related protein YjqB (UPF0714/DUF867 family)
MTTNDATIRMALSSQEDLIARREHCSIDDRLLESVGSALGQQIRIRRTATEYALFTVSERRDEDDARVVRLGLSGRRRLGTEDPFDGVVVLPAAHPTMSDDEAEASGELVERLDDDGEPSGLIVLAPHGGDIERHTDEQAERVVSRLGAGNVSSWRCKGWKPRREDGTGGAFDSWHITSTDISPASFPRLASVVDRGFAHAVAFHGFEQPEILIGGTACAALKEEIRATIETAIRGSNIPVRVATPDDHYGGDDPGNLVNRLTIGGAGGIQIEQSLPARRDHGMAIADAVAVVYRRRLRPHRPPWQDRLREVIEWFADRGRRLLGWGSQPRLRGD